VRPLAVLPFLLALASVPAQAQSPPQQRVKLVGFTLDHWRGASGPALLRPTLRFTMCPPSKPGVEFAVVAFPDGISIRPPAVLFGLQGGLTQPVAVGPVTILPRVGAAAITALGLLPDNDFIRIAPGVQAGLGVLVPVDRKSTIRLDVTRHVYRSSAYGGFHVWSFGLGVSGRFPRTR
jgi:hypothetical protein